MFTEYLALDEGVVALMIPIVAILIGGLTGVLKLMTNHQKAMAELYRQNTPQPELLDEIRALRGELADMKDQVNRQTLLLDRPTVDSGKVFVRDDITER